MSVKYVYAVGALLLGAAACATSDLVVGTDALSLSDAGGDVDAALAADASLPDTHPPEDDGGDAAGDVLVDSSCPELTPPPPSFCGGAPYAPTFAANGCTNGFACTPMTCATGGGACVALAPGACASNHIGPAMQYDCGGGLGVECCLP